MANGSLYSRKTVPAKHLAHAHLMWSLGNEKMRELNVKIKLLPRGYLPGKRKAPSLLRRWKKILWNSNVTSNRSKKLSERSYQRSMAASVPSRLLMVMKVKSYPLREQDPYRKARWTLSRRPQSSAISILPRLVREIPPLQVVKKGTTALPILTNLNEYGYLKLFYKLLNFSCDY